MTEYVLIFYKHEKEIQLYSIYWVIQNYENFSGFLTWLKIISFPKGREYDQILPV